MLVAAVLGASSAAIVVPGYTLLQERAPAPMRARVYATLYTVSSAAALGPVLGAGVLSDLIGVGRVMLVIALTLLIVGAVSLHRAGRARPAPAHHG